MAGQRLTDKTALAENTANNDNFLVVDTSDTTGSSVGTSKKVLSKFIIQTDKVTISNAEYKALNTSAKTLVAAPGAGFVVMPLSCTVLYTEGGTANSVNTSLYIGYKAISANYWWDYIKSWSRSPGINGVSWNLGGGTPSAEGALNVTIEDEPLIMWLNLAPTGTATGTATAYITYQIVKL